MPILDTFKAALKLAHDRKASDLHASAGGPMRLRIHGEVVPIEGSPPLTAADLEEIAANILVNARKATAENVVAKLADLTEMDCSYSLPGLGRFRANLCQQRGSFSAVLYVVPSTSPSAYIPFAKSAGSRQSSATSWCRLSITVPLWR